MDRLGFFKHGLSSVMEATQSIIGLKKAASTFTEAVEEALSDIAPDIGLHLPSLDAMMYDSPSGTLYEVCEMGYTMIEVGCYYNGTAYGVKAEELYSLAQSSSLKIASLYLNKFYEKTDAPTATQASPCAENGTNADSEPSVLLSEEDLKWWERAFQSAVDMKCRYVTTTSYPMESTAETIKDYARYFAFLSKKASEKGLTLCYHPTHRELKTNDGVSIFDKIAEATAQSQLAFQIDTLEADKAEADTVALIKKYGKRIASLHLHDEDITTESERIDFNKIIRQAQQSGVKDIFIEVSNFPLPPQNCVERSIRNIEMLDSMKF